MHLDDDCSIILHTNELAREYMNCFKVKVVLNYISISWYIKIWFKLLLHHKNVYFSHKKMFFKQTSFFSIVSLNSTLIQLFEEEKKLFPFNLIFFPHSDILFCVTEQNKKKKFYFFLYLCHHCTLKVFNIVWF